MPADSAMVPPLPVSDCPMVMDTPPATPVVAAPTDRVMPPELPGHRPHQGTNKGGELAWLWNDDEGLHDHRAIRTCASCLHPPPVQQRVANP